MRRDVPGLRAPRHGALWRARRGGTRGAGPGPGAPLHRRGQPGMTGLPIAITQGDPAGIGGEIVAKAFRDAPELTAGCFVVGDLAHMRRAAAILARPGELAWPVALLASPADLAQVPPRSIPLVQVGTPASACVAWGRVDAAAGRIAADAVAWAARAALQGQ